MLLRPDTVLGEKFSLRARIGAGGMGEVWLAVNRATGAEVALKIAFPSVSTDEDDVDASIPERFKNEAQLGAKLSHRNVVRVFDYVEDPSGALVLVMELLRGRTVEALLRERQTLPPLAAVAIARGTLLGLEHAHEHGSIHRDVKPGNVFLEVEPDGHVTPKLFDFGIAKVTTLASNLTVPGTALGTPKYMSPEQIRCTALDGRSDVFATAILLYEAMTGVSPFHADSAGASIAAVLEREIDPDARIPDPIWREIKRALKKPACERHASAKEFADALLRASGADEAALDSALRDLGLRREVSLGTSKRIAPQAPHASVQTLPRTSRLGVGAALFAVCAVAGFFVARGLLAARHEDSPKAPASSVTARTDSPKLAPHDPESIPPVAATIPSEVPAAPASAPRESASAAPARRVGTSTAPSSSASAKKRIATSPGF